jgi:WD40 repeat protein
MVVNDEKQLILITGHKDGKVLLWEFDGEEFKAPRTIVDYKHEIIEIIYLESGLGITTDDSLIHIWDLGLKNSLKDIDLSNMPFKLYSLRLKNIVSAKDKIFFNTYDGDMIMLNLKYKRECSKNTFIYKFDAKRLKNIVKLKDNLTSLTLIERVSFFLLTP